MQGRARTRIPGAASVLAFPVKRSLATLLGAALAAALTVAAPALSVRPYRPEPVEFEVAAPAAARAAASGGGFVSPALRAPKRFNVVGLRWKGSGRAAIAVRVHSAGGRWSRWTPVPAAPDGGPDTTGGEAGTRSISAPVWAGEADLVQYRLSRPLPGLRLEFVNATGTATAADRARTAVRRLANRGLLAVIRPGAAHAQGARPPIVPRADWEGGRCEPRRMPGYGEVRAAFVHHTVTANDYTPEQAPAAVLAICRYHRNSNGWDDIGYNFVVDKYGTIYEGRAGGVDKPVVGAQAQGYNGQTTGIANLGTHAAVPQTEAALAAIARLIRWKLPFHGQPTAGTVPVTSAGGSTNRHPAGTEVVLERVSGHRDGNATSCPGDALYAQLDDLRRRVGSVVPARPRTAIAASVQPPVLAFPGQATISGRVRRITGQPLAGVPVEIQHFVGIAWRTFAHTTSGADGTFAATLLPSAKRILRARFPGDATFLPSVSRDDIVEVRPALAVKRSVARARVGRTPVISGAVQPAKSRVVMVVDRRGGGVSRRVARVTVRTLAGNFRKGFRLRTRGLYRFRVLFPGDRAHLPVSAPPVHVRAAPGAGGASAG